MRKKLIIGFFVSVVMIQIAVPVSMIVKREAALKHGMVFRFETQPIDPYDAFRGRYVALRVRVNSVPAPQGVKLRYGQRVYAQLFTDKNGFAQVSQITMHKPESSDYLTATVSSPARNIVWLDLPIDRYYMQENAAPRAEEIYRQHSRRNAQDAYVVVRVKDGFAVIEGLYVGGQRIEDLIREAR